MKTTAQTILTHALWFALGFWVAQEIIVFHVINLLNK